MAPWAAINLATVGVLVDAQVVEDNDVTLVQLGAEHLGHIGGEDFSIGGTFDQKRRIDPVPAQGGDEGGGGIDGGSNLKKLSRPSDESVYTAPPFR